MAASPRYKIYRRGEYIASCKYLEDAVSVVSTDGGDVRFDHAAATIIWTEGDETFCSEDNVKMAVSIMATRERLYVRPESSRIVKTKLCEHHLLKHVEDHGYDGSAEESGRDECKQCKAVKS